MKRRDLIKLLEENGFRLIRAGGSHDIYYKDGVRPQPIPRHTVIKKGTAKAIIRRLGL